MRSHRETAFPWLAIGGLLAAAALVALGQIRGDALWTAGEGVYALTCRMALAGADVYDGVAVAQPPGQFFFGSAVLAVDDTLGALRDAVAGLQVLSGLLAATVVWRITRRPVAVVLCVPAFVLTPWAVHENATLIPEQVSLPLELGAVLGASRRRSAGLAGALAAGAVLVKWPNALAATAIWWVAADRRRYATGALGLLIAGLLATLLMFGSGVWEDTVLAQAATGHRSLRNLAGLAAQSAWNIAALAMLAGAAVHLRGRSRDPALLACAAALAAGACATSLTLTKNGTGLYVLVGLEGALVPLAFCGAVWLGRRARGTIVVVSAVALLAGQSASLLAAPSAPRLFVRPGAAVGYAEALTRSEVHRAVAAAERCPPGTAYSGESYIAFLARRRMPGGQPDTWLIAHSSRLAGPRRAAQQESVRCP